MRALRIAIAGGSLGGLFAATLLRLDGHHVQVYERSKADLAGRGAGLVAQPEVMDVLREIGRADAAQVGVVARDRIVLDQDGRIISRQATPQMQVSWDNLFRSLRSRLDGGSYSTGRGVVSVHESSDEAALMFDDGSTETADLVIAADGLGSVLRPQVTGDAAVNRFAGYVAWRGLVPETILADTAATQLLDRFAFYMAEGSQALGYSITGPGGEMEVGARRYNWVWYRQVPPNALTAVLTDEQGGLHPFSLGPGQLAAVAGQFLRADAARLLPPAFAAAIAAEARPFVQAIFDYQAPRMVLGRVALLGDAAFVVRPHTAMGASKAAGDAISLRNHLRRLSVPLALPAYERERMPVGNAIAAHGMRLGATLEPSNLKPMPR